MLITGKTGVFCVIGYPIQHSLSPVIHNAGFEAHGLDFVYVPFALHPDNVEAGLKGLQALGVMGMTVTVPLKELVLPFLDHIDESARHTGAVNTVLFKNGRAEGFNLDVAGVAYSLKKLQYGEGAHRAVVLGTGGAARAVVAALMLYKTREIVILNRREERAAFLRDFFAEQAPGLAIRSGSLDRETTRQYLSEAELLVNTTPVGMYPNEDESPIAEDIIPRGIMVLDAIYRPEKTMLLGWAEAKGCTTLCGLDWLVHQGALAFTMWTGKELDREMVKDILRGPSSRIPGAGHPLRGK